MADAMFSFETNISKIANEVDQALSRINQSLGRVNAPATADLLGNISGQVRGDVDAAIADLKRLRAAADQLARSGVGLPEGQRTLSTEMDARIRQLQELLRSRAASAAQQVGASGLNVDDLMRELERNFIAPLRRLKRDLMREVQTTGTPEQQAIYGPRTRPQKPTPPPAETPTTPPAEGTRGQARAPQRTRAGEDVSTLPDVKRAVDESARKQAQALRNKAVELFDAWREDPLGPVSRPTPTTFVDRREGEPRAYSKDLESGGAWEVKRDRFPFFYEQIVSRDDEIRTNREISEGQKQYARHLTEAGQSLQDLARSNRIFDDNAIARLGNNVFRDAREGQVLYSKINPQGEARPVANPDEIARLERSYAEQVDAARREIAELLRLNAARAELARQTREASGQTEHDAKSIDNLYEARRALMEELRDSAAAERRRVRETGEAYPTGVRQVGQYTIDPRFGEARVYRNDRESGGVIEVAAKSREYRDALDTDEARRLGAETRATNEALRQRRQAVREEERAERELTSLIREDSRRGLTNNFLAGLSNPGFGGNAGFSGNFEGLARSAGQAVKYSVLYDALYGLQAAAAAAAAEFLDAEDSIVELTLAMGEGSSVSADFQNNLQDIARQGGDNVGEAMDIAASGIRAFSDEATTAGVDVETMGEAFARQSKRISILTKTAWGESANNMKAIANGFKVEPSDTGFAQIADAIAGAKLAGGGDETEIAKGLAGSALSLSQMGYSLREAATIVSALNAQTAESGQLVATRISRVGSIFGGASGKSYLRELNTTLDRLGQERIDLAAPVSEQIQTLANAWNQLPSNIQETTINRLGGTSSPREFQALMESIGTISEDAANNDFFNGAAARELEERLKNVRNTLNYLLGDLKAIVTNIAMSGVAAPFVELIKLLKTVMDHLATITKYMYDLSKLGSGLIPFAKDASLGPILANIAALAAGIKLVSAIRQAGGVRGVISGQEARFMPGRALARQQLGLATGEATPATPSGAILLGPGGQPVTVAQRAALRAAATADNFRETATYTATRRATAAEASFTGTKADDAVHAAAAKLRAAADDLDTTVAHMETNARAEGRRLTAAEQDTITQKRLAMANANAELERAEGRQGRAGGIQDRAARERGIVDRRYATARARVDADFERAQKTFDLAGEEAAKERRTALEQRYVADIARIEARRIAAETQLANSIAHGRAYNAVNNLSGGAVGRIREASLAFGGGRAGLLAGARQAGAEVGGGLRNAGRAIGSQVGVVGGLLIGIDIAAQFNSALSDLKRTASESERVRLQDAGTSADSLEKAAQAQISAAESLQKSQEGFFGTMADWATGGSADEDAKRQRQLGERYQAQADEIRRQMEDAAKYGSSTSDLMSAVDWTDADTIAESFKNLASEGHTASERVDLLTQKIGTLGTTSTSTLVNLSSTDRNRLAIGVGNRSDALIDETLLIDQKRYNEAVDPDERRRISAQQRALEGMNREDFRAATEETARSFIAEGGDLSTDQGRERYRQMLIDAYERAGITPAQYGQLIDQVIANTITRFQGEGSKQSDFSQLKDLIANILEQAPQDAQEAARDAQYEALSHGGVDTSASVGARTNLAGLEDARDRARTQLDAAIKAGTISDEQAEQARRYITQLDNAIKDGYNALFTALAADAKKLNEVTERRRKRMVGVAPDLASARAINSQASTAELQPMLGARDTESMISWIENTDSVIVAQQRKLIDGRVKLLTEGLAKAKESGDPRAIAGAQAALDRAKGEQDAFLAAMDQAAAPGGAGLNAAQLAATQRAATATRNRDSLAAAKAARDMALENVRLAKNDADRARAQQEYWDAINKVADEQIATKNALADVNAADDSRIDTATRALRDARQNLAKFQKDTKEYAEAQRAVLNAERDLAEATAELSTIRAQLGSDLTNPLQQAAIDLDAARAKAARDRERVKGLPKDVQDEINGRNELAIRNLLNQQEATTHSEANNLADLQLRAGEISKAAWLRAQRAELERIQTQLAGMKETDNGYEQLRNEALEQKGRIRDALNSMADQWNLGDIKVPTPYEVRRSLEAEKAGVSNLGSTQIVNTTNNITVNGADFAKVEALLKTHMGGAKRYTTTPRRA